MLRMTSKMCSRFFADAQNDFKSPPTPSLSRGELDITSYGMRQISHIRWEKSKKVKLKWKYGKHDSELDKVEKIGTDLYKFWQNLSQIANMFVISTVRVVPYVNSVRTCLQMPKFIFPCLVKVGDHRHARYSRILDDLDESESAFYLLFPFK